MQPSFRIMSANLCTLYVYPVPIRVKSITQNNIGTKCNICLDSTNMSDIPYVVCGL